MRRFFTALLTVLMFSTYAQTAENVTDLFLSNAGFDSGFNYNKSTTGNVSGDVINNIAGWEKDMSATYTVAGIFEYGSGATFNGSNPIPNSGYNGSTGGALALTTGWGTVLKYSKEVTLPAGKYDLVSAYYNAGTATAGESVLGWVPGNGVEVVSQVKSFPVGAWITDTITFIVPEQNTSGKIQVGFQSVGGGSGTNAKILVDYVKLFAYGVDSSILSDLVNQAEQVYNGAGVGASEFLAVINRAKQLLANSGATMGEIIALSDELKDAILQFQLNNASVANPLNMTHHIVNPSFEAAFTGWTNRGMATQTNTNFPLKAGNTYVEKWVNRGDMIPDVSISQMLSDLPYGKYAMTVSAGHIQQVGAGGTVNNSTTPQTGVSVYAGYKSVPVDTLKKRTLEFMVIDNQLLIGLTAENATGNWLTCDDFQLFYLGEGNSADLVNFISDHVLIAEGLLAKKMQNPIRAALEQSILASNQITSQTSPNLESLKAAGENLYNAVDNAKKSIDAYVKIEEMIDEGLEFLSTLKEGTKTQAIQNAINLAETTLNNLDATDAALAKALSDLEKVVIKKIYTPGWMGNINDPNNEYTMERSRQSRNWIVFWESGYGLDPGSHPDGTYRLDIDGILRVAELSFDIYADSLKFIERGRSKTDDYKMVIRLRYTNDWDASGSGVDDRIGLLTLSAPAAKNPGHTVAHEVGHCFQYQVHCDNNDYNGWLYGFGPNASGGNGWWEQCAQWQGFKVFPEQQFTAYNFPGYMNTVHKHILHEKPRYDNYFIQDFWTFKHGMDIIGRLWNESKKPEDPVDTYKRITGISQKQFNDEMYECATRFATWDIPALKPYGESRIDSRPQPEMRQTDDGAWIIEEKVCPENYGHNIIKLNASTRSKKVTVYFEGKAGADGYRKNYVNRAGWRFGFVALLRDGTRVYSEMGEASYSNPEGVVEFEYPDNCKQLWLVVSGAPSTHWLHPWDDDDSNDEQWPYQVKFDNTNLLGKSNMMSYVGETSANKIVLYSKESKLHIDRLQGESSVKVYSVSGACVQDVKTVNSSYSVSLQPGIYLVEVISDNIKYNKKIIIE